MCTRFSGERQMLEIMAEALDLRDKRKSATLKNLKEIWTPDNPFLKELKNENSVTSGIFCSLNGCVTTNIEAASMLKTAYSPQFVDNYSKLLMLKTDSSDADPHYIFLPMALGGNIVNGATDDAQRFVVDNMLEEEETRAIFCPIQLNSSIALVCCHLADKSLYLFSTGTAQAEVDNIFSAFQLFITALSVRVVEINGDATLSAIFTRKPINAGVDLSSIAAKHSGPLVCVLMDILSIEWVPFNSIAKYVHKDDMHVVRAMIFIFMHGFSYSY
jgi:hypothetical protein